jgi:hypothetical protein
LDPGDDAPRIVVHFSIDVADDITTASPEPNIFEGYDATATDIHRIVAAVTSFWRASRHGA